MIDMPAIPSPTKEALPLPCTTKRSADVNLAWKKILLDLCTEHPRDDLETAKRQSSQIPSSSIAHLLGSDQLWQSLELRNKAILPTTKRRLRRFLPSKKLVPPVSGIHEDDHQDDRNKAKTNNEDGEDSSSSTEPSDMNARYQAPNTSGCGPEAENSKTEGASGLTKQDENRESEDGEPQMNKNLLKQRRVIEAIEEQSVAAKPWSLRGEVIASSRPINSLLESTFEFDTSAKPNLLAEGDLNGVIEDMIRQRIVDGRFDDVLPLEPPRPRKPEEVGETLDSLSEKPSKGLGELYEEEYRESDRKKQELLNSQSVTLSRRDKEVADIYALFERVSQKLDALSRTSATPVINDIARTAPEAVPEDLVKEDAIVSAPDTEQEKSRNGKDSSSRTQRKKRRRKR